MTIEHKNSFIYTLYYVTIATVYVTTVLKSTWQKAPTCPNSISYNDLRNKLEVINILLNLTLSDTSNYSCTFRFTESFKDEIYANCLLFTAVDT